ncbi:MAG TPA: peptidylprolyl isomerase [Gemmatimonadales bacterium]
MTKTLLVSLAAFTFTTAGAQQPAPNQTLDRIVAVVGSRPILASQIEEEMVQQQAQGQPLPTDSVGLATLRRQILDRLIELEILVQQAERDTSIKVTDQEVLDQVEQTYQNVRKQFSSENDFRDQIRQARFGSVEEWRRWLADEQRRQLYAQRLIEQQRQKGKLRPIPPTDAQMREFWEQNKEQQPKRPATVSFRQIVIKPVPDSAARLRALQLAESLVVQLRHGGDFAATAKRYSGDSASAAQGGELGWFRRGVMVKEFEDVAFRIRPGEISGPVETSFGFHIINVERTQPAEILARHVLISPEISAAQIAIARRRADSLHDAFARGSVGVSFDSLAKMYADPQEPKLAEEAPFTDLPPEYQKVLASDTTAGLKPVIAEGAETRRPKFVVLEVTARHDAGELSFDDVKLRIRQSLGDQLAIRHFIDQLKRQIYIDIRL